MRAAEPHKGRPCTTCTHPNARAIDRELLEPGAILKEIAARYPPLVPSSLARHRKLHIAPVLKSETVEAFNQSEIARGATLTERIDGLFEKASSLLQSMEEQKDFRGATGAIREMRGCLELLGKIAGQIDPGTTINVFNAPAWVTMQTNVITALAAFPEARMAVVEALKAPQ